MTWASPEEFARALFESPVTTADAERDRLIDDEDFDPWYGEGTEFVRLCTGLFESFGALSAPYSAQQIDQGLWSIRSDPFFLPFNMLDEQVPVSLATACVRAAYHLYADFLAVRRPEQQVGSLYMWWDEGWPGAAPEFLDAVLETLERILAIPEDQCRRAALHGLAHFKQDWDDTAARGVISGFLTRYRDTLPTEMISYAEFCRDEFHV